MPRRISLLSAPIPIEATCRYEVAARLGILTIMPVRYPAPATARTANTTPALSMPRAYASATRSTSMCPPSGTPSPRTTTHDAVTSTATRGPSGSLPAYRPAGGMAA